MVSPLGKSLPHNKEEDMSIASNSYAEYANRMLKGWVEDLSNAAKRKDLTQVKEILKRMKKFKFSE